MVIAIVLSTAEVVVPLWPGLAEALAPVPFALLSLLVTISALVARIVAQRGLS